MYTHTHIYTHTYIYMCICVCICFSKIFFETFFLSVIVSMAVSYYASNHSYILNLQACSTHLSFLLILARGTAFPKCLVILECVLMLGNSLKPRWRGSCLHWSGPSLPARSNFKLNSRFKAFLEDHVGNEGTACHSKMVGVLQSERQPFSQVCVPLRFHLRLGALATRVPVLGSSVLSLVSLCALKSTN